MQVLKDIGLAALAIGLAVLTGLSLAELALWAFGWS
jgi:hypothetical protein